jgi:hypothetical protein
MMKILRDWERDLQMCPLNEEFPVSAGHKLALITSLPFVHTKRWIAWLAGQERKLKWSEAKQDMLQTYLAGICHSQNIGLDHTMQVR